MKTILSALSTWGVCCMTRWYLDRSSRKDTAYLGGRVRLRTLWNHGAAFGLPIPKNWLTAVSAGALAALLTQKRRHPVSVGLILGGGFSNLLERVREGRVYDYIHFPKAPGPLKRYVYNLADFAIFAGCLGLLLAGKDKNCPAGKV